MATKIYIVEDHPIARQGMTSLIEPEDDLTICGEAGSAETARREIAELEPDLVIIDLTLEEGSGLTLIKDLQAERSELPILVISMHDESLYARRALEAGARGYLMKSEAYWEVVEAIHRVLDDRIYLSKEMTSQVLSQYVGASKPQQESPLESLSDRELEVYTLMGRGYGRREIAEALSLSPRTIDTYRDHLKEKLGIDTNAKLRRSATVWVETESAPDV